MLLPLVSSLFVPHSLSQSSLSAGSYTHLTAGLRSGRAKELDLSYSRSTGDQGVERLCAGLAGSSLQTLR